MSQQVDQYEPSPGIQTIALPVFEPRDGLEQYVEKEVDKCTNVRMTHFRDDVLK